ncbi:MAG: YopX family protein [Prevotella sp.]|nr:YopX family protein [Prevotella sp.]
MRTIKFKAKTLKADEWIVGDFVCINGVTCIKPEGESDNVFPICTKVAPDTVCQFTGFLDKNGNEIYEGDVLRLDIYPCSNIGDNDIDDYYEIIRWSDKAASFCMVAAKNPKSSARGTFDGIADGISQETMQDFEVIGNIHEEKWQQYGEYFKTEEEKEADND